MEATRTYKPVLSLDVVWSTISFVIAAEVFVNYLQTGSALLVAFMVLDLQAGYLFWTRNEARALQPTGYHKFGVALDAARPAGLCADTVAIAAMVVVVFYEVSPAAGASGETLSEAIMLLGAATCFVSCWTLGTSFGVLPRYRGIKTRGAYRIVRHPMYASMLVIEIGYIAAHPTLRNLLLALIGTALLLARMYFEESMLSQAPDYVEYKKAVRHRLVPGVW